MASGGITVGSSIVVYYIAYNLILQQEDVHLSIPFLPKLITAPVAALGIESVITFLTGFMLNKYLVFTASNLKGRVQLFRYGSIVATNLLLNYALLKLLVEAFSFYPTVAKICISVILAVFSYFSQKHFSFKVRKEDLK